MNRKQKIPLLCVVALTIIISIAMAVMDAMSYASYSDAQQEIDTYQQKIISNSQKKPSFSKDNSDAIHEDSEKLKKIIAKYKMQYGKPFRGALQKFAAAIGSSEDELRQKFAEYYNALKEEEKGTFTDMRDYEIWKNFMKRLYYPVINNRLVDIEKKTYLGTEEKVPEKEFVYDTKAVEDKKKKIDAAFAEFAEFAKQFAEFHVPETQYKCLLDALGLPTTAEHTTLNAILIDQKYWEDKIPGLENLIKAKDKGDAESEKILKQLLISLDLNVWHPNQLSLIFRQLQIKQDLYKRMKTAQISRVEYVLLHKNKDDQNIGGFSMNNNKVQDPLQGTATLGGSFLTYTYRLKIRGKMNSIRRFLDELNNAYKDCRVYNVRDLVLTREVEAEKITSLLGKTDNSSKKEGQEVPDSYGRIAIGRNMDVSCEILLDYIIYVQDLLPRQVMR